MGVSPGGDSLPVPPEKTRFCANLALPTVPMSDQDQTEIRLEFAKLKQEHADFDAAINAMIAMACDPIQIQRMKKKKLHLKDRLSKLGDRIVPDIIA
jgi:hypothetical protein